VPIGITKINQKIFANLDKKFPSKVNPTEATKISRAQLLKWIANGEIPILVGTHALIQKTVQFENLAYVIIDEQHRFGTAQRQMLTRKDAIVHLYPNSKASRAYMEIAKIVSMRSTCIRAHVGTVIIKNDTIVSTGYNGSPRGESNCCDLGICERYRLGIEPGKHYEICHSIHSEANAIINAARSGISVMDGDMYLYFERLDGQKIKHGGPCLMCSGMIKNVGIKKFIIKEVV